VNVAHPIRPELKGKPTAQVVTFGPKSGEQIADNFCAAGRQPQGGWVEYNFPKPGETQAVRKVSYVVNGALNLTRGWSRSATWF
jgi:cytochrome c